MDDPSYGTKMKDAIKYSLNQECYLRQFLNDGKIPIDNGATERAERMPGVISSMCWKRCLSTWMIRTEVFWMT